MEKLNLLIKTLPHKPGVYQYFDAQGTILYVGKAKNLKKRVSSYFTQKHEYGKTRVLVSKIADIKYIIVDTETDALLLENSLIKKLQPRYNVMLKDSKTYPWICIKKEAFPRICITRHRTKDGSDYYGPFTSVKTIKALFFLIDEIYSVRTYTYNLGRRKSNAGNYLGSLEHQIKNRKKPFGGIHSEKEYLDEIDSVRDIIKGNFKNSLQKLNTLMLSLAKEMRYEEAQEVKEKITLLQNYQAKSTVINPIISNVDVFSIFSDEKYAYINFFKITNGAIVQSHTSEIKKKLEETDKELLELSIVEIRQRFNSNSYEIYVPFEVDLGENIKVTIPKMGDKKRIVDLSLHNAKQYRQERFKQIKITNPERHTNRIMAQMKKDLRLLQEPRHIECFDNSNIQGTNPVAACVVFKNGKPSKKDYRKFNIKTVEGANDFASMEEVVFRRYKRLLDEQQPLPQLIIIDGGKGQLSSALKSLDALGLRHKIAIIGIAKRLEELYYPNDPIPLYLDKTSETLKIIQFLRNEAHRFGITFHRNKRSKKAIQTELELIEGIGEKTITTLLKHFKSGKRIANASENELIEVIGNAKGSLIFKYYHKK